MFLDELGDIPLAMQVKLLRLLETGTYRRVGGTELIRADIRLVSATHRPLKAMVEKGQFWQDLFYRVNTFPIGLPPLRRRREDIPLLAEALLKRVAPERPLGIAADALTCLINYDYPGNVRELRNILERASLLCDGDTLQLKHLPEELLLGGDAGLEPATQAESPDPRRRAQGPLSDGQLLAALQTHRGSRKSLAAQLGMSERTLYRRIKELT